MGKWWHAPWRRRWVRVALLIVLGVVIGAWGMGWFVRYQMQAMMAGGGPKGMKMSMPVEGAAVEVRDLDDVVRVPGTLAAEKGAVLRAEGAGVVKDVPAKQGAEVKAGTVLVRLDDTGERAETAQAQASMRLTQRNMARLKALRAEDAALVSQKDYDTALSAYEQAAAAYRAAADRLDKRVVEAPFDGVAGIAQVNPGDYVSLGQEMISLQTLHDLRVDFALPERFAGSVNPGDGVTVQVASLGASVTGTIVAVDTLIDVATRNLPVRARIDNSAGSLRPGMFGDVEVSRGKVTGALMVPESALMPEGDRQFVYKFSPAPAGEAPATGGAAARVAERVEVTTGIRLNGWVQATSGLTANDIVVSAGQMKIGPGSPIVAMNIGMVSDTRAVNSGVPVSGTAR